MILITGATGTVGSEVVKGLAARGVAMRAMTRNPAKAAANPLPHVEFVRGDFDMRNQSDARAREWRERSC